MRRTLAGMLGGALIGALALAPAGPAASEQGVAASERATASAGSLALTRVGRFDEPVYLTGAPGFPRLLFVVEQSGRIRVISGSRKLRRPFLDISGLVRDGGEQGLLSLAFHPAYKRNRLFYVFYTDGHGDLRVEEFKRRSRTRAARGSRRPVLRIPHRRAANHNGGQLQFLGHHLYIGTGDGGGAGDPPDNAKSKGNLLGKLLRIDPRDPRGSGDYSVPRSNPFVGRRGRDEIFSYGLRNPWRFSFDLLSARRPRIVIGDVGQDRFEEVDYETLGRARGAHFGWDEWEGFAPFECDGRCARGTRKPVYAYRHDRGCTVIGGYVVRDRRLGALRGDYVFSDLCDGTLRAFGPRLRRVRRARSLRVAVDTPSSFGEDRRGRLYVASLNGPVYRLVRR
jgi:glucose/arabinose dehydrogenase